MCTYAKRNTPTGPGERRERKEGMEPAGVLSCQDPLDLFVWSRVDRAVPHPVGLTTQCDRPRCLGFQGPAVSRVLPYELQDPALGS
jgi:hypothetical protein